MSSLKELYSEIIKTQQDIAVTYGRVVSVENELKKKLNEDNKNNTIDERLSSLQEQLNKNNTIDERLSNLQEQLNNVIKVLSASNKEQTPDKNKSDSSHQEGEDDDVKEEGEDDDVKKEGEEVDDE